MAVTAAVLPVSQHATSAGDGGRAELIYVATAGSGPVAAYRATAHGPVLPVLRVANPANPATVWDPWGITFDRAGYLYVQSFLGDATTFVFRPGAHGHARPARIFEVQGPDNESIAVDRAGFEYVIGTEAGGSIAVARPRAAGTPKNSYIVHSVRTIQLGEGFNPWPDVLTAGPHGEIFAVVSRARGNEIVALSGGAHGSSHPVRAIAGPATGLGTCAITCDEVSITYSAHTGLLYAAVSTGHGTHISLFRAGASGDARPIRVIAGPHTGLRSRVITGIAVSSCNGRIYALVKRSQFGRGWIEVFARAAADSARPLTSFTNSRSRFSYAEGIAITGAGRSCGG